VDKICLESLNNANRKSLTRDIASFLRAKFGDDSYFFSNKRRRNSLTGSSLDDKL